METRDQTMIMSDLAIAAYQSTFKRVYKDFQNRIHYKINNKVPADQSFEEYITSGCLPKPSYYVSANYYMAFELTIQHTHELGATILSQLYPIIRVSETDKTEFLLRVILEDIANRILQMNVVTFQDIKSINFRDVLLHSQKVLSSKFNEGDTLKHQLKTLPIDRMTDQQTYLHSMQKLMRSKAGLWKVIDTSQRDYEREIESDFVVTTTRLT